MHEISSILLVIPDWIKTDTNIQVRNFKNKEIGILSIDVEGLDLEVLTSLDLSLIKPQAFVIESFSSDITKDMSSKL